MKQIILVRHGEKNIPIDLVPTIDRDSLDVSLTPKGKEQSATIKKFLQKYQYQTIFCSLYKRAIETAEIINSENSVPLIRTNAFNEYYIRPDKTQIETTTMGITRTMGKIYSLFDQYESVLIVCHSSINQTILQCLLNIEFKKAATYFKNSGEAQIVRYDWTQGDSKWKIIDAFVPQQ